MVEFTGERLVPGQVDQDLWNEHFARYAFAARLARRKRVLDIACGLGYGSAELARHAHRVTSLDIAPDAVRAAASEYAAPNISFLCASAQNIPLAAASFDLIVAFEVIEHLSDWQSLLNEAQRLLAPGGQFIVSTPNKSYYAQSRKTTGPNPFHVHEFEFDEFRTALSATFPSVTIFVQNHVGGILFQPCGQTPAQSAEVAVERSVSDPGTAHFFVAVCALSPQTGAPSYAYLPAASNVLRERELHIDKLEQELAAKNQWLDELRTERDRMMEVAAETARSLTEAQQWAATQDAEIAKRSKDLASTVELLDKAELTVVERTRWAQDLERQLAERTKWAQDLERDLEAARAQLSAAQASRWLRLGRKLGLGPDLKS